MNVARVAALRRSLRLDTTEVRVDSRERSRRELAALARVHTRGCVPSPAHRRLARGVTPLRRAPLHSVHLLDEVRERRQEHGAHAGGRGAARLEGDLAGTQFTPLLQLRAGQRGPEISRIYL